MRHLKAPSWAAGLLLLTCCSPALALDWNADPTGPTPAPRDPAVLVFLQADGRAEAYLFVYNDWKHLKPGDPRWKEAMSRFLGGEVQETAVPSERAVVRRYQLVEEARREGWVRYLEIDPEPLLGLLMRAGERRLHLRVQIEDRSGFAECTLAAPRRRGTDADLWRYDPAITMDLRRELRSVSAQSEIYHYDLGLSVNNPIPPFRIAYGHRPSDFLLLIPLALLPVPVLWTLWRRRRVLNRPVTDPALTWYSYKRFLRRLEVGLAVGWTFWIVGTPAGVLLDRLVHFAFGFGPDGPLAFVSWDLLSLAVYALPPVGVCLCCQWLSYPVYTRIRGIEWTRGELVQRVLTRHVAPWLGFLLAIASWLAAMNMEYRRAVIYVVGAFLAVIGLPVVRRSSGQRIAQPLDTGVVRDRVFELARRAGVKVNQVYLQPTTAEREANAAAAIGNKVILTDYLLQHLSPR
jgi:hypothetical protein